MMHFISGLPRSGSTLLASILNQNPTCFASIMSPVGQVITTALQAMGPSNEAHRLISNDQRIDMLTGIFTGYYANYYLYDTPSRIIFDNNRRWTANIGLLAELFPECKVICCVRSPAAIVDSFERLFQQNPLNLSVAYGSISNTTVYERVRELLGTTGAVGFALNALRSAYYGPHRGRLVMVAYDDLCRFPSAIVSEVADACDLPAHNYRFESIDQISGAAEFDEDISSPGMHALLPKVEYVERQSILPPDIWESLPKPFWLGNEEVTTSE